MSDGKLLEQALRAHHTRPKGLVGLTAIAVTATLMILAGFPAGWVICGALVLTMALSFILLNGLTTAFAEAEEASRPMGHEMRATDVGVIKSADGQPTLKFVNEAGVGLEFLEVPLAGFMVVRVDPQRGGDDGDCVSVKVTVTAPPRDPKGTLFRSGYTDARY